MTTEQQERLLQQAFKGQRAFMVPLWRLGLGKLLNMWADVGGRSWSSSIRAAGLANGRTPVNYTIIGEDICISGFGLPGLVLKRAADARVECGCLMAGGKARRKT